MKIWGFVLASAVLGSALFLCSVTSFAEADGEIVDARIVFAIDVSSSVRDTGGESLGLLNEYQAQRSGLIEALADSDVHRLFRDCNSNGIAVTYAEWSGGSHHSAFSQVIGWRRIRTLEDLLEFAQAVDGFGGRTSRGETDIAGAVLESLDLLDQSEYQSPKSVIFLSTDGRQGGRPFRFRSDPYPNGEEEIVRYLHQAREAAERREVSISVLGIVDPNEGLPTESELIQYHESHVITGPYQFVVPVQGFEDYADGVKASLMRLLNNCHL